MQLEEVTIKLQSGSLTLQESIDLYESGIKIAKDLEKQLSVAESNIDTLRNQLTNINLDSNEDD
ncbi:MAG: Exonuclease VII small subunit [Chloroflexi bacterium]|mgnify:CR=1 FL=1|jgi:exodeoxyribonuclease VII small subunit|nr:MAG: Exonuclease VII small subunit [Chloroflexota bacterium]|tara:strand:+ start:2369 stop:2560 length:192 start_codon:yes stop_codon:yes gene_type:complete